MSMHRQLVILNRRFLVLLNVVLRELGVKGIAKWLQNLLGKL